MDILSDYQKLTLAQDYCRHYHENTFRKGTNQPFSNHPFNVAEILRRHGYIDIVTQCIAYLHDTIEDTSLTIDQIKDTFGYEIADGVYVLSKNKGKGKTGILTPEEYIQRLNFARNKIKRIKIADTIDNTRDLQNLSPEGIEKKIIESQEHFIPWGREIAPLMVQELIVNIQNYHQKIKNR